jgi:hypothetical protein
MSTRFQQRKALRHSGRKLKPTWDTYYELGTRLMPLIPAHRSLEECGREFGISKQNAYTEVAIALGKVAYRLRRAVPDWKEHEV